MLNQFQQYFSILQKGLEMKNAYGLRILQSGPARTHARTNFYPLTSTACGDRKFLPIWVLKALGANKPPHCEMENNYKK
jgi:hypothetical protein